MPIKDAMNNPHSDRVKRILALQKSNTRDASRFLIEGPQNVREAVKYASDAITDIYVLEDAVGYVSESYESNGSLANHTLQTLHKIVEDSLEKQCYVHPASAEVMRKISLDSQGIVAVAKSDFMENRWNASLEKLKNSSENSSENIFENKKSRFALCWQVRDPGNAGAIIRVADVAGCDAVIFLDDCVSRWNTKLIRSTAGSLFHIPVATMSVNEWFEFANKRKVYTVAADVYGTESKKPIYLPDLLAQADLDKKSIAILFGNEARGLTKEILNRVDEISMIPIYGKAESMNLATSAAVMLMCVAMSSHKRKM